MKRFSLKTVAFLARLWAQLPDWLFLRLYPLVAFVLPCIERASSCLFVFIAELELFSLVCADWLFVVWFGSDLDGLFPGVELISFFGTIKNKGAL